MKEIIRKKIREAITEYDWRTRIEYEIEQIDLNEIIDEAIDETLDLKILLEDYIKDAIYDEIDNLDIEEVI